MEERAVKRRAEEATQDLCAKLPRINQEEKLAIMDQIVKVEEILVTNANNYKHIEVLSCASPSLQTFSSVVREDLNIPGTRCFLLHNLLSPEECSVCICPPLQ
jgi:hypothetical protein